MQGIALCTTPGMTHVSIRFHVTLPVITLDAIQGAVTKAADATKSSGTRNHRLDLEVPSRPDRAQQPNSDRTIETAGTTITARLPRYSMPALISGLANLLRSRIANQ